MPGVYKVNGQPATKAEYDAAIATMGPITGKSSSDLLKEDKQQNSSVLGESPNYVGADTAGGAWVGYRVKSKVPKALKNSTGSGAGSAEFAATDPRRLDINNGPIRDMGNATVGGEPPAPEPVTEVNVQKVKDDTNSETASDDTDMRVRIKVPTTYLNQFTNGLGKLGPSGHQGIIFPYTPQISIEHKAEYSSPQPLHSNYAINFYKNSSVSEIGVTGRFTVQNDEDAILYLSTVRLLTALTKMKWGKDSDAGAPPPVCRFSAYGEYNFKNVPVAVASFKHDYPDQVDFYTVNVPPFGLNSVPTIATLSVTLKIMYSRQEMRDITISGWLDSAFKGKGYL